MRKIFVGALFLLLAIPARAVESVSVELGGGTHSVELWRVGAQWQQRPKWLKHSPWQLYWDLSIGSWNSHTGTVHDFGLTPEFRYPIGSRGAYFDDGQVMVVGEGLDFVEIVGIRAISGGEFFATQVFSLMGGTGPQFFGRR